MKALKLLPLVIALGLAACGEKEAALTPSEPAAAAPVAAAPAQAEESAAAPAVEVAPAAAEATTSAAEATTSAAPAAADLAKGEQIFNTSCVACHGAGVMGAPKAGDKAAWDPRMAKGSDTVYANAIKGFNMMPARGGNPALKDEEVKAAVDYMVHKPI